MTNRLIIDSFLIFKHIEIDVNRYTVFIGPQASGKSIVAKLLYIFYHFPETAYSTIINDESKRELKRNMTNLFSQIFSEQIWKDSEFTISFMTDAGSFTYEHKPQKKLVFTVSDAYDKIFATLHNKYVRDEKAIANKFSSELPLIQIDKVAFFDSFRSAFARETWGLINNGGTCTFVPAGRSSFAILTDFVFTLWKNNIHTDYFIKEFGVNYEQARNRYSLFFSNGQRNALAYTRVQKEVLKGYYIRKNQRDYLKNEGPFNSFDVEVLDASSGQQELLPILLTLFRKRNSFFMIEEPEAHIYPESQYALMRFIISRRASNDPETAFLFTTHSPYIITVLNNLARAGYLENKLAGQKDKLDKLDKIYPKNERIPFGELSAYMFVNGTVKSIIDKNTRLINAEELDSISDKISSDFSSLVNLEFEE